MKAIKIILSVLIILVIVVIGVMWWVGFFTSVKLEEKEAGGYKLAGLEYRGAYSTVGPTMTKADSILRSLGIISSKGFGIYFDNPQTTPKEKCRSFVGDILETADSAAIQNIIQKGLKIDSVPVKPSLVIEYPIKNKMSFMVGPAKAYPLFNKYMTEKGLKPSLSMEVYDMTQQKIIYIMQIEK